MRLELCKLCTEAIHADGTLIEISFWKGHGWKVSLSRLHGGRRDKYFAQSLTCIEAAFLDLEMQLCMAQKKEGKS